MKNTSLAKKIIKIAAAVFGTAALSVLTAALLLAGEIPDQLSVVEGKRASIDGGLPVKLAVKSPDCIEADKTARTGQQYSDEAMLFGAVPVKSISVSVVKQTYVVPCGLTFGVKFYTAGVVIVGMTDVDTANGPQNPAYNAGVRIGDVILAINGKAVSTYAEVSDIFLKSGGRTLTLNLKRGSVGYSVSIKPEKSMSDGAYKAGLWVRDSTAGIGTITFYKTGSNVFGGLGHGICDVDTGKILPLMTGNIVKVNLTGIQMASKGQPGELQGTFCNDDWGSLCSNTEEGVFGTLNSLPLGKPVPVAMRQEVNVGPAEIIATLDVSGPKSYSVQIEKIHYSDSIPTKNMIIRVTDSALLKKTGGIVQGMSGCPIIQNGRLVGAVTHVFVNEPQLGYAIFAENMLDAANSLDKYRVKDVS